VWIQLHELSIGGELWMGIEEGARDVRRFRF
jgi:hypothetical protein